jgi:hypothetical protein
MLVMGSGNKIVEKEILSLEELESEKKELSISCKKILFLILMINIISLIFFLILFIFHENRISKLITPSFFLIFIFTDIIIFSINIKISKRLSYLEQEIEKQKGDVQIEHK